MRTVEENGENEVEGRCTRVFEMRERERERIVNRLGGREERERERGGTETAELERSTEGPGHGVTPWWVLHGARFTRYNSD